MDKKDSLLPCPFCGGEAEYHRFANPRNYFSVGCSVCRCTTNGFVNNRNEGSDAENKALNAAIWNRRVQTEDYKEEPLTLDELKSMDGEPVWIVEHPNWGHWELSEYAEGYLEDRDEDFYGLTMPPTIPDPMGRYGLHMLGWLAYRYKPIMCSEEHTLVSTDI